MTGHSRQCAVWPLRATEKLQTIQERQDRWQHTWMKGCKERSREKGCGEMRDAGAVRLADRLSIILYEAPQHHTLPSDYTHTICVCECVFVSEWLLKANASKSCLPFSMISFPPTEREREFERQQLNWLPPSSFPSLSLSQFLMNRQMKVTQFL